MTSIRATLYSVVTMIDPETDQEGAQGREAEAQDGSKGILRRLWSGLVYAWQWLRAPDVVGNPVTLRPRRVRLLIILLTLSHLALVGVLLIAPSQPPAASDSPPLTAVASPTPSPTVVNSVPSPGPTPTVLGSGGAIAFSLRRDGNTDIYALNQETRQLVRLTHHVAEDRSPAWSPDGEYLAFASNRADNWDIYLLDLASGALIRLTHDESFDGNPSWSPDGEWLAFETYRDGNLDVYVMSTMGRQVRSVTTDSAPDFAPAWAPDGEALAFTSLREGRKDIYLYSWGGDEVVNITQSPDLDEDKASWSVDGTRLAYVTGPGGQTSVHVVAFDWETLSADQTRTEFFGTGDSPAWAPDGESLLYVHIRGERSHLVAASMTGWALFHEVHSTEGFLDDIIWTDSPIPPRVVARVQESSAGGNGSSPPLSFYAEVVQPTPEDGPPCALVSLPGVTSEEGATVLSDRVNDSFNALRRTVREEAGWDYLDELGTASLPLSYTPPSGHSRRSWHLCGRAFDLDQEPYEEEGHRVVLVREDLGNATYWRVFLRAAEQDGSLGEPLRTVPWDLNARQDGGRAEVEGGERLEEVPSGYYVDFTALARDYGWERVPSLWRWRYFWPDIRWWDYRKSEDLTWWACMLEVLEPEEIESTFGPIPGGGN